MTTARTRRRGFTLIELLVVMSIIALLAALSAGTYFRIYGAEKVRATNALGTKLNSALDRRWEAVNRTASQDHQNGTIPPQIVAFAGNDRDRARVIWTYMQQKINFPTSFAEAKTDVILGGYTLRHLRVFDQLPSAAGVPAEVQSAACLYLALTATGSRGDVVGTDGLEQQSTDLPIATGTVRVFVDAWDTPILFVRLAMPDEVNATPYLRARQSALDTARDPNDPALGNPPVGSLARATASWTITGAGNSLDTFWTAIAANHYGVGALIPATTYPTTGAALSRNWVTTVISAGPNKQWNGPFAPGSDDIISFRLRREGNRGD